MGNAGQTTYGAANACAEASSLAARRAGTPACVARWGAWAGGGMASSGGNIDVEARMRRVGLGLLDPNDGLRALAHLLGGRRAALVVCPFDWSRYADRHPDAAKSSFLANGCLANARGMNRDGSDAARDILDAEGPSVAASKIPIDDASKIPMNVRARASATAQRVVVEVTTRLLGAPPEPNAPLLDAGLDSLSSAELADALETAVRVERAAANPACAPSRPSRRRSRSITRPRTRWSPSSRRRSRRRTRETSTSSTTRRRSRRRRSVAHRVFHHPIVQPRFRRRS